MYDRADPALRNPRNPARARRILLQPSQSKRQEALSPQLYRRPRCPQPLSNLLALDAKGGELNDLSALYLAQGQAAAPCPAI